MAKLKKSVWLPLCLAIYMAAMSFTFADEWIKSGHALRFYITVAVEVILLILLVIFLRKRENIN